MTWKRGTYVRGDATRGTTPVEARLALEGLFDSFGIIRGLGVTGTAGWSYNVAAGHLVTKRVAGDGVILFANDGPVAFPTIAAPGTGSRWDVLWVRHNDVDNADANSEVTFGVTNGTASGSPTVPTIPTGAFELGRAIVPALTANTNAGGVVITSSTVKAGLIGPASSGWINIAIAGGFAAHTDTPQVSKVGNRVFARGGWASTGLVVSASNTVGTVPVGYRPLRTVRGLFSSTTNSNSGGRIAINTDGTVQIVTQSSVGAFLALPDGISWTVD